MIRDSFENSVDSVMAPSENFFPIVPSDSEEIELATKAVFVGQGGNLAVMPLKGQSPVVFANIADGSVIDIRVRAILATGTTAAQIVGLA